MEISIFTAHQALYLSVQNGSTETLSRKLY